MAFAYYRRLNKTQRRIYDRSDAVATVLLQQPHRLQPLVHHLHSALQSDQQREVTATSRSLISGLCNELKVAPVRVVVRSRRPVDEESELHGLYTPADGRRYACIEVWMRTAQRRKVVAFRTYLRTLLHEFMHHLDLELLQLPDSFHTEGFYKRESSLFKQLVTGTGL